MSENHWRLHTHTLRETKVDLLWIESDVGNTSSAWCGQTGFLLLSTSIIRAQIDFGFKQIVHAKEIIAHYEAQVSEYRLILDVGLYSGQAGREWGAGLGLPKCLIKQDLPTQVEEIILIMVSMQGSSLD